MQGLIRVLWYVHSGQSRISSDRDGSLLGEPAPSASQLDMHDHPNNAAQQHRATKGLSMTGELACDLFPAHSSLSLSLPPHIPTPLAFAVHQMHIGDLTTAEHVTMHVTFVAVPEISRQAVRVYGDEPESKCDESPSGPSSPAMPCTRPGPIDVCSSPRSLPAVMTPTNACWCYWSPIRGFTKKTGCSICKPLLATDRDPSSKTCPFRNRDGTVTYANGWRDADWECNAMWQCHFCFEANATPKASSTAAPSWRRRRNALQYPIKCFLEDIQRERKEEAQKEDAERRAQELELRKYIDFVKTHLPRKCTSGRRGASNP